MKILVPFDFSKESLNALTLGKEMALKLQVGLKVIHAIGIPDYPYYKTQNTKGIKSTILANAQTELQKVLESHFDDHEAIEVEVSDDNIASAIIKNTHEREIKTTILGRKPQLLPDHIGSSTRSIIRYAEDSIISISKPFHFDNIKEILFVTDFEATPVHALSTLKLILNANKAKLRFLYVNTKEQWQTTAETKLCMEKFCQIHRLVNTQLEIINDDSLEKGVLQFVKDSNIDLIAIKIQSASGKLDIVETHLSAERIIDHTKIPVLTYSKEQFVV